MLFGVPIWRLVLIVVLIYLVVKRADMVAIFGKIKYQKGQYPEALRIFRVADKVGNLHLSNKLLLGYVCLRCGELKDALLNLRFCLTMTRPNTRERNQVKNLLALAYWKDGALDDAIETLEEVLESGYRNTVVYQNLGIMYNLGNDPQKALKFNLEAYDFNADDAIICDNLAESYALCGEYDKAIELYEAIVTREPAPTFPEVYYGYGQVLIGQGRKEEGLAMIKESLNKTFSYLSIRTKAEVEALYESYAGESSIEA